ncbi:MAG: thioredoxin family protein [Planctomycetes bacterium]|nr:thioredoxin family protein [Planctomycetota bacterium]
MLHALLPLALFLPVSLPEAAAAPAPVLATTADHGKIPWFTGTFDEAIARAKAENKLVFIDFWTTWCGWCKKLDKDTYSDDAVVAAMKDIICLNIDAESKAGTPLAQKYGVSGFPTMIVLDSDGMLRDLISGYMPPEPFKVEIERIIANKGTVGELRALVTAEPSNVDKRWKLASRLQALGDKAGYEAQVAEIKKLDPEGKSMAMRFIALNEVMTRVDALWRQNKAAESPALLQEFLANEVYPEVQFRVWNVLGQIYGALAGQALQTGNAAESARYNQEARKAQVTAWQTAPDKDAVGFGKQILKELHDKRDQLNAEDRAFALAVATRVEKLAVSDADALDLIACAQHMNGNKDAALAFLKRALDIDPKNARINQRLKEFGG